MLLNTSSTRTYDLRARTRAGVATQTGQALDESPSLIDIDNSSNEVAPRVEGPVPIAEATTAIRSYSDVVASRSPSPRRERLAVPRQASGGPTMGPERAQVQDHLSSERNVDNSKDSEEENITRENLETPDKVEYYSKWTTV